MCVQRPHYVDQGLNDDIKDFILKHQVGLLNHAFIHI